MTEQTAVGGGGSRRMTDVSAANHTAADQHADTVEKGMGSLLWLLNNAHNHDTDDWPGMYDAARADYDRGLRSLASLRARAAAADQLAQALRALIEAHDDERLSLGYETRRRLEDRLAAFDAATRSDT